MEKEAVLSTNKLCKSFKLGDTEQKVLKELDFEIYKGDFTVIMGASGSGKTTLLYALSGMDKPTDGSVIFAGEQDLAGLTQDKLAQFRSKNCGFVFQQIYLVDSLNVLDNVLVSGLINNRKNKKQVIEKAKEVLKVIGLEESDFKKFPSQLSGGMSQRVAVARAAVTSPMILFADEPTGALDSENSRMVLDILTDLNNKGQSIIMVTHDTRSARRANRILYLKDGKIEDELLLDKYVPNDKNRHAKVKDFLAKQGW